MKTTKQYTTEFGSEIKVYKEESGDNSNETVIEFSGGQWGMTHFEQTYNGCRITIYGNFERQELKDLAAKL